MGGRKASATPSDQGDEVPVIGSEASITGDGSARNKSGDIIFVNGHLKEKVLEDKPIVHSKRKTSNFGAKCKRLRIENEDVIELKLTWKEAQGLMRAPAKIVPSSFVVEGCEFEEFEGAEPVIGRPTIFGTDHFGEKIQWVQCEDCFKWRKVPADAVIPSRWTCSDNVWDRHRSLCSSGEELTKEQLELMLPTMNKDTSKNEESSEKGTDLLVALEGLDTLANLAIQGEGEGLLVVTSSEIRTKHPRHKPGCTCIVCLQPPSGKGAKHKESCDCVVCGSLKRRFRTLMERKEKKQLEKEAESSSQSPHPGSEAHLNQEEVRKVEEVNGRNSSSSPLKAQIDLNIQPEREEDLSDPAAMKCEKQQRLLNSHVLGNLLGKQEGGVSLMSCVGTLHLSKNS